MLLQIYKKTHTKKQTKNGKEMIYKILHRKINIEPHEPH